MAFTIGWMLDFLSWYLGIPLGFILNSLCWIKLFAVKLAVWEDVLDQYVQSIRWVPEVSCYKFFFTGSSVYLV